MEVDIEGLVFKHILVKTTDLARLANISPRVLHYWQRCLGIDSGWHKFTMIEAAMIMLVAKIRRRGLPLCWAIEIASKIGEPARQKGKRKEKLDDK